MLLKIKAVGRCAPIIWEACLYPPSPNGDGEKSEPGASSRRGDARRRNEWVSCFAARRGEGSLSIPLDFDGALTQHSASPYPLTPFAVEYRLIFLPIARE